MAKSKALIAAEARITELEAALAAAQARAHRRASCYQIRSIAHD